MVTKLEVYQIAVRHLGAVRLHDTNGLTENRDDRRALDAVYVHSNNLMLESGLWKFATRTVEALPDNSITPAFGNQYVYPHPDDYVALYKLGGDEYFRSSIEQFENNNGAITCEFNPVWLMYISSDEDYGWNLGKMPAKYVEAWGCMMALMTNLPVTGQKDGQSYLEGKVDKLLQSAKVKDAFDQRVQLKPQGRWTASRGNYGSAVRIQNGRMRWAR